MSNSSVPWSDLCDTLFDPGLIFKIVNEDDEFLLDAPGLPSEPEFIGPQDESGEEGMAIDEEGRPRFAPARDIVRIT